ncbi:hypothetical protein EJ02DRAFT_242299 [Clathrospora elynae]|uniref:Osmotin, thaumatin-like protein n=1 Tax=Clathrospora elynae TaxID=706981 RepID=A0A6A5SJY7_9PLEO|nr:hypothetical protein EJ02DRAFT_242299 [Clathrospora elynae]
MQLTTYLSAASAMVATVSAIRSAVTLNEECKLDQPHARIVNRCDYDVHLWSVLKGTGCPGEGMVTLKTGETYKENYDTATDATGVSIKVSKTEECKGNDIVQLEYFLNKKGPDPAFYFNYLDVSYVDCLEDDCPTKQEGYYLVAGNQTGFTTASAGNTWCPVLSCHDPVSCAKMSYILPDDTQTKTCDLDASLTFYMCGGDAPTDEDDSAPTPSASSKKAKSSTPAPTSTSASSSSSASTSDKDNYTEEFKVAAAAAVTPAPEINEPEPPKQKTKTNIVYVTAYEYVNVKRHSHDHARRHQPFHA